MWTIHAGTVVSVCKEDDPLRTWQEHTMQKTLTFRYQYRTEDVQGRNGAAVFKQDGWLILLRRNQL